MRVAQDDLGAHVNQLVDEKQAALKHLLVHQHTAARLGGRDEHLQAAQVVVHELLSRAAWQAADVASAAAALAAALAGVAPAAETVAAAPTKVVHVWRSRSTVHGAAALERAIRLRFNSREFFIFS